MSINSGVKNSPMHLFMEEHASKKRKQFVALAVVNVVFACIISLHTAISIHCIVNDFIVTSTELLTIFIKEILHYLTL